jgi:hypothetical protein
MSMSIGPALTEIVIFMRENYEDLSDKQRKALRVIEDKDAALRQKREQRRAGNLCACQRRRRATCGCVCIECWKEAPAHLRLAATNAQPASLARADAQRELVKLAFEKREPREQSALELQVVLSRLGL